MNGLHFVLTRKFTSDDIEGIFSAVRAGQGRNDQSTAAGCLYALEIIQKTGIFTINCNGNTAYQNNDTLKCISQRKNVLGRILPEASVQELSVQQKKLTEKFSCPPCNLMFFVSLILTSLLL